MCGIACNSGLSSTESVRRMLSRLRHRGPDSEGLFRQPAGTVGHVRLSIVDLAGGRQPILDETGARSLVSNSEIYNHTSLRRGLRAHHRFRTRTDSEVILHLYEESGPRSVRDLDGMFAFAIAEGARVFAARDPLGIKPLYYGRYGEDWLFASEIKALLGEVAEVREFPPGSWFSTEGGFQSYYRIPEPGSSSASINELASRLRHVLEDSVRKRLMADVPVGVFLSGGLDSSVIAALARRHMDRLHTFSVGTPGSPDLEAAREVAGHLGTIHHEAHISREDIIRHLPKIIYHLESFDRDLVRSAIPCYFVSRLAARHVKVVLTGEGADELFAGYGYYRGYDDLEALDGELRRCLSTLHDINLQRVDRMTMAHALEGRVPFLDRDVIELAMQVPVRLKLRNAGNGRAVDKWMLRASFADLLPERIVERAKQQFDEGSGSVDAASEAADSLFTAAELQAHALRHPHVKLRSREETVYHRLLWEVFGDARPVESITARWSFGRTPGAA